MTRRTGSHLEPLESRRMLASTLLDPTFGIDGRATLGFTDGRILGTQPGGRIIVQQFAYGSSNSTLFRLNGDGSLDPTFKVDLNNFPVPRDPNAPDSEPYRDGPFDVSPIDGRIAYRAGNDMQLIVVLRADGTPDTTFDGDGMKTV